MQFERVYDFRGAELPVRIVFDFGLDERMGEVRDGYFRQTTLSGVRREPVAPFGPGLALVLPCTFEILDPVNSEVVADAEVGIVNGRPGCVSIRARPGHELTGEWFRKQPVARWVTLAASNATVRVMRTRRGAIFGAQFVADAPERPSPIGELARELATDVDAVTLKRSKRVLDEEFLEGVADVYRDAVARRYPPAKALIERFGPTTRENARRWIQRARDAGKLGPSPGRGRLGEQREEA